MRSFDRQHRWLDSRVNLVIVFGCIMVALVARFLVRDFQSPDYIKYLERWYNIIVADGGFASLRLDFADYSVSYLYLMALGFVLFPAGYSLYLIKIISVIFDFIAALAIFGVVRTTTQNNRLAWVGFCLTLLCPTVIANSALWAQADAIYTAFLLISIWRLLKRDPFGALCIFAVAFAFKLQAIFMLPLFIYLLLDQELNLLDLLVIPAIYALAAAPAILMGRSPLSALLIYLGQAGEYDHLTMNAPSIFQWLPSEPKTGLTLAGLALAGAFVVGYWFLLRRNGKHIGDMIPLAAFVLLLGVPFFLPRMHERYFYPADVLSIALACSDRRLRLLPLPVVGASALTYAFSIFNIQIVPMWSVSALVLIALVWGVFASVRSRVPAVAAEAGHDPLPRIGNRRIVLSVAICTGLFAAASAVGPVLRTQYDRVSTTGVLTYDRYTVLARNAQAIRCPDRIRVNITWSDAQDPLQLQGAHVFVHVVDQGQKIVAQQDGPTQPYPLLLTAFAETHDIPMPQPQQAAFVKFGLYQISDQGQRYRATKYDGTPWPENAVTLPIVDGVCR